MSNWPVVALGSVASIDRVTISPEDVPGDTVYVGLENIARGGGLVNLSTVAESTVESLKYRFTSNHVLFGKLRPYLAKIARPDCDGICSTDVLPIAAGDRLDRAYLAHYLSQPAVIGLASSRAKGANLPRLSPTELAGFGVPLPPLADQIHIADTLDRVNALRAKRRTAIALLDDLVRSIFLDMFGDPAKNTLGWPEARLGEAVESGPQNGLYKPASSYGSGTPIVRIDAFYGGTITCPDGLKRVVLDDAEIHRFALSSGDILINRVNSIDYLGKCALVPELAEPTVFESNMMRLSVDPNVLHPLYLIRYLCSGYIRSQILTAAKNAVNQSSINQRDVGNLRINIPPIELQRAFADRLVSVEDVRAEHTRHLIVLDALFSSVQDRAFRGELSPASSG